ncbi:MAG: APC family permease [Candidatus Eremiobacteraeota bacterium]|nr:APC family permease [Candidatus Eremiobacteraeota bacterium]
MEGKPKPALRKISIFNLVMISAAFIVSVRNLPMLAETGMKMIFFSVIAVLTFLIPTALVSAELATGWPKQGGVYAWVREAFGDRWGFLAIWLQWIQMVFGMVTVLSFVAGSLAYVINPALATNKWFIIAVILVIYWSATLFNMRGMKTSSLISTVCVNAGVFIPGALIIILGIVYLLKGSPVQFDMSLTLNNLVPKFKDINSIALMTGIVFIFSGIEASSAHANEVENPQRNFPKAILLTGLILVGINVIGAMSVAIVVPQNQISLASGLMEAFKHFFSQFNMKWLLPVMAIVTGLGAVGQVSTWILGPVKGLLSTAQNGDIPPLFSKLNKNKIPTTLLILQASLVSIIGILFFVAVPNINTAFIMVLNVTMILYLIMYILMFISAIKLRYSEPEVERAYKVPGGNPGMWLVAIVGILTSLLTIFVGFFPPAQLHIKNPTTYRLFISLSTIIMLTIPFIIYALRKPSWQKND